jgi:ABC-type Zn2+ transport system substrate-binding protein/surface adhesin
LNRTSPVQLWLVFRPRLETSKSHFKNRSKGKINTTFPDIILQKKNHKKIWERGKSSDQGHRDKYRRYIPHFWLLPRQHKEVAFTILDLG